jgi:hypothetical protein
MANSGEQVSPVGGAQRLQLLLDSGGGQVGPADHSGDQVAVGAQSQELLGFGGVGQDLHQYGSVDPGVGDRDGQVAYGEVPSDRGHIRSVKPNLRSR